MNKYKPNYESDPLKQGVWGLMQPKKGKAYPLVLVLAAMLMWAMAGLSLLAFIEPSDELMSKAFRCLGWILSGLFVPLTLSGAADLINRSRAPVDLFKGLD